ncbi:MAG: single-stranded-DNA-specific exonuclease RecJ [Candidatus Magasanikbacteria bacterium CG10_big_fil_rev_8_21_14_0_10_36_32]|uniref:Single-stranded-DNA-specific exonuclease RecJ n=1 Tax=Candidatus Magasanikbacteria bacterium CG10_big_fil_rev_8_21_14_0_10_36_32 TaxID=1974646 RepID=A0A2M6W6C8_9BACT|nr:MAG: single-stranded-DNA-specific exonuclease RecJ [Candidatus Magasanikbacteria bacterium CG10_big_fil_rev_8_21_14_0_10_36_32]
MKKWVVTLPPPEEFIGQYPELPPIICRLLWNRNIKTQEAIDEFLNPDYVQDIHDPFIFQDMEKATKMIFNAIKKNKNIVVHGDYDADGVCSAAILIQTLKKLGAKKVNVFLPHRETDGYGLNTNTVKLLREQKTDLIITCDCGVSNLNEIKEVKKLGMDIIVTDHHTVPIEIPPADAIIHPLSPKDNYPCKTLAGAAVAFKLAQGLLNKHQEENETLPDGQTHEAFEKWILDLVAVATIADMVPLLGESRTLARYGLTVLNKTKNLGLRQLLIAAGVADETGKPKRTYDSETVSFQLAPRLNAAGRMDHANSAFALLMAEDEKTATDLAVQLGKNNYDRQKLTEQLVSQAISQIKETKQENNAGLFVIGDNWSLGIIGLIAGKLKDLYYKPSFVMGLTDGEISGSARSIAEFNLIAAMKEMPEVFSKFGGHPQAGGFSLKSPDLLESFKEKMLEKISAVTAGMELAPQITIDAEVDLDKVDWKLYDILQRFEPFGQANEEPKYLASDLTVVNVNPVGQDRKHLQLMVKHNSQIIKKTIAFGFGDIGKHPSNWREILKPGDKIDMVFRISVNEWNGNRELQLTVIDLQKK